MGCERAEAVAQVAASPAIAWPRAQKAVLGFCLATHRATMPRNSRLRLETSAQPSSASVLSSSSARMRSTASTLLACECETTVKDVR
jgi:hypothetical protein